MNVPSLQLVAMQTEPRNKDFESPGMAWLYQIHQAWCSPHTVHHLYFYPGAFRMEDLAI